VSGDSRALERLVWVPTRRARIMGIGPAFRGRSGAGLGDALDGAPDASLAQGRTSNTKPALILRGGGQGNVMRGNSRNCHWQIFRGNAFEAGPLR
jgi:hypothetical protein